MYKYIKPKYLPSHALFIIQQKFDKPVWLHRSFQSQTVECRVCSLQDHAPIMKTIETIRVLD